MKPTPTIPPVETLREALPRLDTYSERHSNVCPEFDTAYEATECLLALLETQGPEKLQGLLDGTCVVVPVDLPADDARRAADFALSVTVGSEYSWPQYMNDLFKVMIAAAQDKG